MSILAPAPTRDDTPEAFLGALFASLAAHRTFPKFQFERRASDCIALFLPEIVRARYGWAAEVVAPEFPLKKENNQSTNVDYLLRVDPQGGQGPRWVLVELKTDRGSIKPSQLKIYLDTLAEKRMDQLVADVDIIWAASQAKERYQLLRDRLQPFCPSGQLELLYLTPDAKLVEAALDALNPEKSVRERVRILTFEDVCKQPVQRYPAVWELLCETLLRPLSEAAPTRA